jgi:hypothetical protein
MISISEQKLTTILAMLGTEKHDPSHIEYPDGKLDLIYTGDLIIVNVGEKQEPKKNEQFAGIQSDYRVCTFVKYNPETGVLGLTKFTRSIFENDKENYPKAETVLDADGEQSVAIENRFEGCRIYQVHTKKPFHIWDKANNRYSITATKIKGKNTLSETNYCGTRILFEKESPDSLMGKELRAREPHMVESKAPAESLKGEDE